MGSAAIPRFAQGCLCQVSHGSNARAAPAEWPSIPVNKGDKLFTPPLIWGLLLDTFGSEAETPGGHTGWRGHFGELGQLHPKTDDTLQFMLIKNDFIQQLVLPLNLSQT